MKIKFVLATVATFLLLCFSNDARANSADEAKTVAALDTQYQAAVKANDAATMGRILADDFILVDGDGSLSTKADLLKEARSGRITYEHQEELEQKVRVWGDTAVVTAKLWGKGVDGGKPFEWTLWFSDTYVRTPSGWRYVFGQASLPLPAAPATASAAADSKPHVKIEVIPARPEDVSTIEAIVKADYDCISGGVGAPRQWSRDLSLYDPHALSFSPYKDEKSGALTIWSPTAQEYADTVDAHFVKDGFIERELVHDIHRFGNVATVFSSYEGKLSSTGKDYTRGVNVYQLYFAGNRWWISSVSWDSADFLNSIPPELQPKK
ncbi:MAG: nuclear transport factor 2 family protein [Candidatus Acidiferrales bacterium]